ncbi:hypothetical protein JTB14_030189 [Gonioctena quinquepunctata]|nr:hypothetical protein JTB14_030189 [Gonioctena quinquepunctata]
MLPFVRDNMDLLKQTLPLQNSHENALVSTDKGENVEYCRYYRSRGHIIENCKKIKSDVVDTRWDVVTKLLFSKQPSNDEMSTQATMWNKWL